MDQNKLKECIGQLTHEHYEGNVSACVITYLSAKGECKTIICSDIGHLVLMLGALDLSKDNVKLAISSTMQKEKF